jgi:CheY-like chemotaxis protein
MYTYKVHRATLIMEPAGNKEYLRASTLVRILKQASVAFRFNEGLINPGALRSLYMKNSTPKKSLLIVDDVELFIQLQISHLGHSRYDIHTAHNGSDGLEKARSLKPDLILMDLFMPDMDGDHICRILKEDPETSSIPVVLVSSGTRGRSRAASVSSKCDGLIFKPVRRDLLVSVVENLLGTNSRKSDRVQVSIQGTVILDEKDYPVTLRTLSTNGAFVEIEQEVIRGDLLELSFPLPDQERKINVRTAAVVWCGSLENGDPNGVGLFFLTISQAAKEQISKFVEDHVRINNVSFDENTAMKNGSW